MKKGWAYPPDLRPLKGCGCSLTLWSMGGMADNYGVYLLSIKNFLTHAIQRQGVCAVYSRSFLLTNLRPVDYPFGCLTTATKVCFVRFEQVAP